MPKWRWGHRDANDDPVYSEAVEAILAVSPEVEVPEPVPWARGPGADGRMLLVPAADYHLDELVPLSGELEKRGLKTVFAFRESP